MFIRKICLTDLITHLRFPLLGSFRSHLTSTLLHWPKASSTTDSHVPWRAVLPMIRVLTKPYVEPKVSQKSYISDISPDRPRARSSALKELSKTVSRTSDFLLQPWSQPMSLAYQLRPLTTSVWDTWSAELPTTSSILATKARLRQTLERVCSWLVLAQSSHCSSRVGMRSTRENWDCKITTWRIFYEQRF